MLNVLFGQLYSEGFYSEQTPTCQVRELTQMAVGSAVLVIGTSGEAYKPNLITLVTIVRVPTDRTLLPYSTLSIFFKLLDKVIRSA